MIKNMWRYRNGCPEEMELESIDFMGLDVRLQKIYENGYKEMIVFSDNKFKIVFNLNELNQLTYLVLGNNIREFVGEGWNITAVNKSLENNLYVWYERRC